MTLELLKSKTGRTLIESHRGVEGPVPENSWTAIQLGHKLGADLIEVDVQLSQDNVAFLRHNYTLPHKFDIDVLSCGSPHEARRILSDQ